MAISGQWIGLREAKAALRRLPEFVRHGVQIELNTTAIKMVAEMERRVPIRTGKLLALIRWEDRSDKFSAVVGIENAAFYWKFLEYGTVKMQARPFARPAAAAVRDDHDRRLLDALEEANEQVERAAA